MGICTVEERVDGGPETTRTYNGVEHAWANGELVVRPRTRLIYPLKKTKNNGFASITWVTLADARALGVRTAGQIRPWYLL